MSSSSSIRRAAVWHKEKRAEKHILDLQRAIQVFTDRRPYEVVRDENPNTGETIFRVNKVEDTPAEVMLITGDALNNLRSALEHLVWQLVEANGQTPSRDNGYPIFQTLNSYMAGKSRKIQGVSTVAEQVIDATRPY